MKNWCVWKWCPIKKSKNIHEMKGHNKNVCIYNYISINTFSRSSGIHFLQTKFSLYGCKHILNKLDNENFKVLLRHYPNTKQFLLSVVQNYELLTC